VGRVFNLRPISIGFLSFYTFSGAGHGNGGLLGNCGNVP
jgi:hypothetical protein